LIAAPFFLGIACLAEPIIQLLLTDKWLPAAPIMQIICVARFISIIAGFNQNLLYVVGRTDLALKQQTIKIAVRVVLVLIALKFGIIIIALAELASTTIHFFINAYYPGKIMRYNALKQIRDISPIVISSLIMSLTVAFLIQIFDSALLQILIGSVCSLGIYLFLILYVFKVPEFQKLITLLKNNVRTFNQ
jgi:O-antigen/teichoic acid export membrane protein